MQPAIYSNKPPSSPPDFPVSKGKRLGGASINSRFVRAATAGMPAELIGPARLARACLGQALGDLRAGGERRAHAVNWFNGAPARLTFRRVCALLGLRPVQARAALAQMVGTRVVRTRGDDCEMWAQET